jgi:hypothetical protein
MDMRMRGEAGLKDATLDHTTWGLDSPFMVGIQSHFVLLTQSFNLMEVSYSTINNIPSAELQESFSLHNSDKSDRPQDKKFLSFFFAWETNNKSRNCGNRYRSKNIEI